MYATKLSVATHGGNNRCDMYLGSVSYIRACKDVFRRVSLLLKAERGDSVFATRYQICGSDKSPLSISLKLNSILRKAYAYSV